MKNTERSLSNNHSQYILAPNEAGQMVGQVKRVESRLSVFLSRHHTKPMYSNFKIIIVINYRLKSYFNTFII